MPQVCTHCRRSPAVGLCEQCERAAYCGEPCQSADWKKGHAQKCALRIGVRPAEDPAVLSENVRLFSQFHKENSKNRNLEPKQIYDINHDNMFNWVQAVRASGSPDEIVDFAQSFAKNLRHVSFSEFSDALGRTSIDIAGRIQRERPDAVVLVIDGVINKSNTWITLLVWSFLSGVVTHLTDDLADIPAAITNNPNKRVFVLQPDDMSYSGTQMGFVVADVTDWTSQVTFLPVVGFMGSAAVKSLKEITSAFEVPSTVSVIPSLKKVLKKDHGSGRAWEIMQTLNQKPWSDYYGVWESATLIYFDHKLADRVSIPTKMLVDAVAFNASTKEVTKFRLIHNCEDAIYKTDTGKLIDPDTQFVDLDDEYTCPKAYYKTLVYTFNGIPLTQKDESVLANIRSIISQ